MNGEFADVKLNSIGCPFFSSYIYVYNLSWFCLVRTLISRTRLILVYMLKHHIRDKNGTFFPSSISKQTIVYDLFFGHK